jgi:hypothetical protein
MTYQEEREAFAKLVKDIAKELQGWHVEAPKYTSDNPHLEQDKDLGCLRLYNRGDKITVHGDLSRIKNTRGEVSASHRDGLTMGASNAKGPKILARDITRRLLPTYLAEVERAKEISERSNKRIVEQNAITARLAAAMGIKVKPDNHGKLSLYRENKRDNIYNVISLGLSINVEVSQGDYGVKVTADYLHTEEAEAAIRAILAMRDKVKKRKEG